MGIREVIMNLLLKPVDRNQDLELILAWRSNPIVFDNFKIQDKPLHWDSHYEYWSKADNRFDFIVCFNLRRVGLFSIKSLSSKTAELSIMIGEVGLWGQGVGKSTLSKALMLDIVNKYDVLYANIKSNNISSIKLFTGNGFEFESEFEYNGYTWNRYFLKREKLNLKIR
jgi:RimJ/RimL family protein N-acetyltransferase